MFRTYIFMAILRKELIEAWREKHLRMVLAVGLLLPLFFDWVYIKGEIGSFSPAAGTPATQPTQAAAPVNKDEPKSVHPSALLMGISYGMLLAAFFAVTLALDSFVGEKERNTMEILLGTPATDRELFLSKMLACLLIAMAMGVIFGAIGSFGLATMAKAYGLTMPWVLLGKTWAYSLLLLFIGSMTCASLGVIISSRVPTVRAGCQVLGVIMLIIFLLFMVAGLLLMPHTEIVEDTASLLARTPPGVLAAMGFIAAILLNWMLLSIAIRAFNRERILTGN